MFQVQRTYIYIAYKAYHI